MSEINIEEQNTEFFKKQPLIIEAIMFGEEEKVKELIKSGLDINLEINGQIPLLQFAIINGSSSIVKILVDAGADVDIICNDEMPLISYAIMCNEIEILRILIEAGANVNVKVLGKHLIAFAMMFASSEIVELLIDSGADTNVNIDDTPLLVFSAFFTKEEIFSIILKSGLDINSKIGISYLTHYICGSNFDSINKDYQRSIIQTLKNVREENLQTFNLFNKSKEMIIEILELTKDEKREIWIKRAKYIENKLSNIRSYLDYIDIKLQEIQNLAVVYEPIDVLNMIKKHGTNTFDVVLDSGETALMLACYIGNIDVVKFLLDLGLDINYKSKNNETALSIAYTNGFVDITKLLIERGANVNVILENGKTLHDTAIFMKDLELENLIKLSPYFILNTPQNLVKILKNFTIDKPMKFTTHSWDFGSLKNEYIDFNGYMLKVKEQWDKIKNDLEMLSPNLYKKIFNFLWETDSNIALGWSSIKGLEEWCNNGNNPFEFKVNDKTFADIIYQFKNEIEIRKESDILYDIFVSIQEQLDEKYEDLFTFNLKKLKGKTFYTDIEKFRNGLNKIFDGIIQYSKDKDGNILYPEIQIETVENYGKYLDIYITHIGSYSNSTANNILLEIENGDFADIKENFNNLSDWSIQNSYENENYQVNYYLNEIEILEEKPQGFTHILRFYL